VKMKIRTKDGFRVTHINRRRSIRLMCIECVGFSFDDIDKCTGKMLDGSVCPLVEFRTGRGRQNPKKRTQAVIKHCKDCMGGSSQSVTHCVAPLCPLFPYRQHAIDKRFLFPNDTPDSEILKTDIEVCSEIFQIAA